MKVLVTGGSGFTGRHLLRELRAAGYREIAATVAGDAPVIEDDALGGVEWYPMDVSDAASLRATFSRVGPEVVYHLAGQSSVGRSLQEPLETWQANATGTLAVLTELRRLPFARRRFLLVSSAEVYGDVPGDQQPIEENAPYRPITPYGASKAAAEIVALQEARAKGTEVLIARSFNHIGPGQDERFLVPSIARQLCRIARGKGDPVIRVGNLMVERDFLDVRDAVRAYRIIAEKGRSMGIYNVCSGTSRSLSEIVRGLIELSGTGARLVLDPERMRTIDIPSLRGDVTRLRELGWEAQFGLDRTLRDLLAGAMAE